MKTIVKDPDKLQKKQYAKDKSFLRKKVSIVDHELQIHEMFKRNPNLKKSGVVTSYTEEQIIEIYKCSQDPIYFINNYCYIINLDVGMCKFNTRDYQKILINKIDDNKRLLVKFPRQSGKTTTIAAYAVWRMIFHSHSQIAILANKNLTAKGILQKIRLMYENIPTWLQVGIIEWNKQTIELENGSKCLAAATSSSAIRSMSINFLIIDEAAFIASGIWDEFYASVFPTVASSKQAKICLISTPCGLNHFYKFWQDSLIGKGEFKRMEIPWNAIPDRDDEFKKEIVETFDLDYWLQEFECFDKYTKIEVLDKVTGIVEKITINDFLEWCQ